MIKSTSSPDTTNLFHTSCSYEASSLALISDHISGHLMMTLNLVFTPEGDIWLFNTMCPPARLSNSACLFSLGFLLTIKTAVAAAVKQKALKSGRVSHNSKVVAGRLNNELSSQSREGTFHTVLLLLLLLLHIFTQSAVAALSCGHKGGDILVFTRSQSTDHNVQ